MFDWLMGLIVVTWPFSLFAIICLAIIAVVVYNLMMEADRGGEKNAKN